MDNPTERIAAWFSGEIAELTQEERDTFRAQYNELAATCQRLIQEAQDRNT